MFRRSDHDHASILRQLEDLRDGLVLVSEQVASMKVKLASIQAQYAVGVREKKRKGKVTAEDLLKDILGGEVVNLGGDDEDASPESSGVGALLHPDAGYAGLHPDAGTSRDPRNPPAY